MSQIVLSAAQQHHAKRTAFIQEDRALRPDHSRQSNRFDAEIEADNIVRELRAFEATSIWGKEYASIENPFPGMAFLTGSLLALNDTLF